MNDASVAGNLGYTNKAYAVICNNSGMTLKSVTLHHQYSDDAEQSKTWTDLAPNTTTSSSLEVGYNTGFIRYGQDYWWVEYTLPAAAEPDLAAQLESLLTQVMDNNQDLGAEILACYWIAGGAVNAASRSAAERLKAYSAEMQSQCQPGRDDECHCPKFKEQTHNRLTMVLGLGATLAIAGELLDAAG